MAEGTIARTRFAQFGRIGCVELYQNGMLIPGINTDGLDFKFSASNIFYCNPNSTESSKPAVCEVSILGLNQKTVNYLCQFCDIAEYRARNISCKVKAGYQTDPRGAQTIFHLPVVGATPTMPPENWVTLQVEWCEQTEKLVSYNYSYEASGKSEQSNLYELVTWIANRLEIILIWHEQASTVAEETPVDFFGFNGGVEEAIASIQRKYAFLIFVNNPTLLNRHTRKHTVFDVYKSCLYVRDETGTGWEWTESIAPQTAWKIDSSTGMIGIPRQVGGNQYSRNVHVRTLLNPAVRPQDIVILKSDIACALSTGSNDANNVVNKPYKVTSISHTGHLRGQEWYTDLNLWCVNGNHETAK